MKHDDYVLTREDKIRGIVLLILIFGHTFIVEGAMALIGF